MILLYSSWIKDLTVSGTAWPFCLVILRSMPGRGANSVFYGGGGMIFIISNFICNRVRHRQNFSLKLNPTSHHLTQALDRKMSPFLKCPGPLQWRGREAKETSFTSSLHPHSPRIFFNLGKKIYNLEKDNFADLARTNIPWIIW